MILLLFTERFEDDWDKEGQDHKCNEDDTSGNDERTEHRIRTQHLQRKHESCDQSKVTFPVLVCNSFTNLVIVEDTKLQTEDSFERIQECSVWVQLPSKNEIALLNRNEYFDFLKTVTEQIEAYEEAVQWLPHRFQLFFCFIFNIKYCFVWFSDYGNYYLW